LEKMMEIRDLPEGNDPLTVNEIIQLLMEALPEEDRTEGRLMLADEILALELRGVAGDLLVPRSLAEDVYENLAEILEDVAPDDRLNALRAEAQVVTVQEQMSAALMLGIARYVQEHPEAREKASEWLDAETEGWAARSTAAIQEEATRRLEALEAWEQQVAGTFPEVWETERLTYVHAKLTLQGARSGSFETATGGFRDFLLDAGASVDDLAIF
jgi:hypothetical protein